MLKGLGNLASLMKNLPQIQGMMGEMQEKLAKIRVSGTAGGGMVTVEASGHQKILSCKIDESLIATGDGELIEDLVAAATNQALEKSREAATAEMGELTGGLNLSGLSDAFSQFTGGGQPPA